MRRLLPAIVTLGLLLGLAAPAMASNRVPKGITKINVTLTFPSRKPGPQPNNAKALTAQKPVRRTLTAAATVTQVVKATDALTVAVRHGVCPMIMRLGPELTVVFRNASGTAVATAVVEVTTGNHGTDGSTACFPIHYVSGSKSAPLLGNSGIRMMGKLIGTAIS